MKMATYLASHMLVSNTPDHLKCLLLGAFVVDDRIVGLHTEAPLTYPAS